jgi:outer membrane protein assembly factor BamA
LEPHILDSPINGTVSFSSVAKADENWLYTNTSEFGLFYKFKKHFIGSALAVFWNFKSNEEKSSEHQRLGYLNIIGGDVKIDRVGIRYNYDKRNNLLWSTGGFIFTGEVSKAFSIRSDDISYYMWKLSHSGYIGFTDNIVLALGISLASTKNVKRGGSLGADILPVSETYYSGGADTVRGFKERSLGPRVAFDVFDDNGTKISQDTSLPVGGSQAATYKAELRYQLVKDTFVVSGFVDSGNVFFTPKEIDAFNEADARLNANSTYQNRDPSVIVDNSHYNFEEIFTNPNYLWRKHYVSYGLSFSYLTTLGSINVAYGIPWKKCVVDDTSNTCIQRGKTGKFWLTNGEIHLNIGATF